MQKKTNTLLIGLGLTMATILVSDNLSVKSASAYTASITTSSSITLDATATGDGTSIHSESINIASDCRSGYNLTIATTESSNLYKDGNSSNGVAFTSVDGTSALSSNNNTNKWGYTITSNPTSSTIFSPLSTTASTIKTPSETASPSSDINDTFSINYGTKVDNTITPGSYQMTNNGAIIYYLTMDTTCTQYTVSFNANGGTVTGGGNNPTQNIGEGSHTKLDSSTMLTAPTTSTYTDAGNNTIVGDSDKLWTFWGWNTNIDGTGDWYKDKEEVTDLTIAGSTITLYAQWKQATIADMTAAPSTEPTDPKQIDHNLMQDMSPETCYNSNAFSTDTNSDAHNPYDSSTNPNGYHTITLLDYRGKVITDDPNTTEQPEQYTVSKLADGLCWMTTNLNLGRSTGGENNDGTITLTSDDTDLAENTTFTLPAGDTTSYTATGNLAKVRLTNTSGTTANGAYYTWAAAVANTTSTSNNLTTSICPKNWDLPASNQYTNLSAKSNYSSSNQTTAAPSSFLINGGFTNGSNFYQTSYSYFWTNTSSSTTAAYGAIIDGTTMTISSSTGTTYGANKYYRKNLRCVTSQGRITINYDGNGTPESPTTGSVASQENIEIASTNTRSGSGFTRTNWVFNSWNTAPDGTGIAIVAGASLTNLNLKPGDTITLYAQWLPQYTITYTNNCMSWASSDANCTATASATTSEQKINLASNPSTGTETGTLGAYNKFTLTGWKIKEWTTNADGTGTAYPVSSTYRVPSGSSADDSITLYAHWIPIYTVQYDGNGSDNDSTGMGSTNATTGIKTVAHTNVAEGDTFDLFASNFKRAGYGFVGWSTDSDAWSKLTDNDTTNDAKIWGPNEIITAPAYNGTPITTLYAIWAPAEKTDPSNPSSTPVYLQGWTGCSAMTATTYDNNTGTLTVAKDSVTALTDERDNEVYAIAKLVDGNCWMIENLRLADTHQESGNTVVTTLSTTNTNIPPSNNTLPITNIYNADSSLAIKSNSLSPTSSVSYNASSAPYGWCTNKNAACDDQSRLNTTNTTTNATPSKTQTITSANAHSDFDTTVYAYGNYYNWYSATAGYGTYSKSSGVTDGDLCPAGWHLPYGGYDATDKGGNTNGGFAFLNVKMGGISTGQNSIAMPNKWRAFPNNYVYAGAWANTSAFNRGDEGNYMTTSAVNNERFFFLNFQSYIIFPGSNSYGVKEHGYTIRCLFQENYSLVYDGNGADAGSMSSVDGIYPLVVNKQRLIASNFSRTGYGFAGWSLDNDAATKLASGAQVKVYGPSEMVTIDNAFLANADANNKITLYAVWLPADPNYTLQTFGSTQCSAMNIGDVTALSDTRDSNTYTVAKLEDGNCWTVENLRLDPSTTTFTSSNTNSPTQSFVDAAPLSSTNNTLCNDDTAACVDTIRFNTNNINRSNTASHNSNTIDKSWYSYGVMYNWYTASAGNGDFAMGTGNVAGDICPAGWRLPTSGSNSEYTEINRLANNNSTTDAAGLLKFPDNFILSGDYNYDMPGGRNSYTRLWSATPDSSSTTPDGTLKAFRFGINYNSATNRVSPAGSWSKWDAFAVRCIAK